MPDLRVIFVNRVYWPATSATAQLLTDLAEGLASAGWDVHALTAGESVANHQGVTIHRTGTPVKHGGLLARVLNHRAFLQAARRQLAALAKPGDVIVPLTDPPLLGAMVAEVAGAWGASVVHWIQDIYPEIAEVHFGTLARVALARSKARRDRAWRSAEACVTLGDDMARFVAARDVPGERIRILPNWAPRELHAPAAPASVAERRKQWGWPDRFIVAYSGNLGRVHEFATLLDAATLLRDEPGIVFLFIGEGPRFAEVAAVVRARNLPNVHLLPPEPRAGLAVSLAAADAHCVTLRPDYANLVYPSKLAGVLAAARPVIFVGPADGDIPRLLRASGCGEAFAPGDAAALAAAIRRWQTDPGLATALGAQARAAYARAFAYETALTQWQALLRAAGAPASA